MGISVRKCKEGFITEVEHGLGIWEEGERKQDFAKDWMVSGNNPRVDILINLIYKVRGINQG